MPGMIQSYAELGKLDLAREKAKIDLKISRELLTSRETDKESRYDGVIRADNGEMMGTVSHGRPHISYGEMMGFVTDQMKAASIPFKLKDNIVDDKGDLFQTYVFDRGFEGPDGSGLVPMFIARASYIRSPFTGQFGTYRFVCRNGVTIGKTIAGINISAKQANDMAHLSFVDQFQLAFDRFDRVTEAYQKMGQVPIKRTLKDLIEDERAPRSLVKGILETLAVQGTITLLDKENKVKMKDLETDGPDGVYSIARETGTRWDAYNAGTDYLTHRSKSLASMTRGYNIMSALFAA